MGRPVTLRSTKLPYRLRNDNNQFYTLQLFHEQWVLLPEEKRTITPVFSLYSDLPDRINFGKHYIMSRDPTGYKTAMALLDSYDHFCRISETRWFKDARATWDREMDAMIKSEALDKIIELSKDDTKAPQALVAAKFLANREYRKDEVKGRPRPGRPSKEEVEGEVKRMANNVKDINDDFARIGLVKG